MDEKGHILRIHPEAVFIYLFIFIKRNVMDLVW